MCLIFDVNNSWEKDLLIKRNQYIKQAGEKETHVYFIVSGAVRVYYLDDETEHSIRFGYQNNFITLLDSFLSGEVSNLSLQALKKTIVKRVSKSTIDLLILTHPPFKDLWYSTLAGLVHQQMEREIDLLTASPLIRYQRVLARSPQLFQEIPHKFIASYLRMTPETLSRIKKLDLNQDL
jgi:CRP-like cAMP-binding protein